MTGQRVLVTLSDRYHGVARAQGRTTAPFTATMAVGRAWAFWSRVLLADGTTVDLPPMYELTPAGEADRCSGTPSTGGYDPCGTPCDLPAGHAGQHFMTRATAEDAAAALHARGLTA